MVLTYVQTQVPHSITTYPQCHSELLNTHSIVYTLKEYIDIYVFLCKYLHKFCQPQKSRNLSFVKRFPPFLPFPLPPSPSPSLPSSPSPSLPYPLHLSLAPFLPPSLPPTLPSSLPPFLVTTLLSSLFPSFLFPPYRPPSFPLSLPPPSPLDNSLLCMLVLGTCQLYGSCWNQ